MPKIDLNEVQQTNRTGYPSPHARAVEGRWVRKLGPASGLTEFGVSHVVLKPGAWSSQRHWHEDEDEFLVVLAGEPTLVDDGGRTLLRAGDCVAFPRNDGNGHHVINDSNTDCTFIVVGRPAAGHCHYPDVDLAFDPATQGFCHKDGSSF